MAVRAHKSHIMFSQPCEAQSCLPTMYGRALSGGRCCGELQKRVSSLRIEQWTHRPPSRDTQPSHIVVEQPVEVHLLLAARLPCVGVVHVICSAVTARITTEAEGKSLSSGTPSSALKTVSTSLGGPDRLSDEDHEVSHVRRV